MKRTALLLVPLLALATMLRAQDPDPEADGLRLLNDLTAANAEKDGLRIDSLMKGIIDYSKVGKQEGTIEGLVDQLDESLKISKGNWGTIRKIVEAMGELRSKKGIRTLKKLAFARDYEDAQEEEVQAVAIIAISRMEDAKLVKDFVEQTKSKSTMIARAGYEAFKAYARAKGKVRRDIAEELMKRLEAENPSAGQSGSVSAEQQERFNQLKGSIVASMQALTRQPTINDVENWREWWRENKKRRETWKDEE